MHAQLPSPREMIQYLDRFVQGQSQAKKDLATAVYNHYIAAAFRRQAAGGRDDVPTVGSGFGRHHVLIIGPTGCGKSFIVRLLAEFLNLPYCIFRANALVKTGYVGTTVEQLMGIVYNRAGNDLARAGSSIVFLDEIDKIRCTPSNNGPDVSGEGAQQQLLPLLDGIRMSAAADRHEQTVEICTDGMLFVCTGAFVGLDQIISKRISEEPGMGFRNAPKQSDSESQTGSSKLLELVTAKDLVEYGLIPEFVGRFCTITNVSDLSVGDLKNILTDSDDSVLRQQQRLFNLHGIQLTVTDSAMQRIAELARSSQTGARALSQVLQDSLDDVKHRLPDMSAEGVREVVISPEVVDGNAVPELIKRTGRQRRRSVADTLRKAVVSSASDDSPLGAARAGITNTRGWTKDQVLTRLVTRMRQIGYATTTADTRTWWDNFERHHSRSLRDLLRLAEEAKRRRFDIDDLKGAIFAANTDSVDALIHYLDFLVAKHRYEFSEARRAGSRKKGSEPDVSEIEYEDPFQDDFD